jgi:hypothetical protein
MPPGFDRMLTNRTTSERDGTAAKGFSDSRFEWQLLEKCRAERCSRSRFTNDKRARSPYIDDIVIAHFSGEDARAKRPMPTNIDTSEENDDSHDAIVKEQANGRGRNQAPAPPAHRHPALEERDAR